MIGKTYWVGVAIVVIMCIGILAGGIYYGKEHTAPGFQADPNSAVYSICKPEVVLEAFATNGLAMNTPAYKALTVTIDSLGTVTTTTTLGTTPKVDVQKNKFSSGNCVPADSKPDKLGGTLNDLVQSVYTDATFMSMQSDITPEDYTNTKPPVRELTINGGKLFSVITFKKDDKTFNKHWDDVLNKAGVSWNS